MGRAFSFVHMGLILVPEPPQGAEHRVGSRLPESAQAGILDGFGKAGEVHHAFKTLERIDPFFMFPAVRYPFDNFEHSPRAFAARNAFTAAFALNEVHEKFGHIHHACVLIHDNEAAGTHHGAHLFQVFVVDIDIEMLLGDAAAGLAGGPCTHYRLDRARLSSARHGRAAT